jgi:hypothetical protein
MRSIVDRNVVMRRITVLSRLHISSGVRDNSLPTLVTSHSLLVTVAAVLCQVRALHPVAIATDVTNLCTLCEVRDGAEETIEHREYNTI